MEPEAGLFSFTHAERKKKISRDKRYVRYEESMALHLPMALLGSMPQFEPLSSSPGGMAPSRGHVHRLTFLKKHLLSRAHLDLLRLNVLHAL